MNGRDTCLIYGANGYTGALIAEEAARRGEKPILAGRRADAVRPLAERLGLSWRAFGLTPDELRRGLDGVRAVLHCAGPFSATSAPVVAACLAAEAHYLDITGEIEVFEACAASDDEAKRRGCVVFPGVGFDVVPSDCLAAALAEALPGATQLELAFSGGAPSAGTAKTAIEGMAAGGRVRRDGKIVEVRMAAETRDIPFTAGTQRAVSIPWGDVSTAFHSTGIPNITVYTVVPPSVVRWLPLVRPLVRVGWIRRVLQRRISRTMRGPDAEARRRGRSHLWGCVTDASGRTKTGTLDTPEGYALTVVTSLECTKRVLAGKVPAGFTTPSRAFGPRFITEFEGCTMRLD